MCVCVCVCVCGVVWCVCMLLVCMYTKRYIPHMYSPVPSRHCTSHIFYSPFQGDPGPVGPAGDTGAPGKRVCM